MVSEAPPRLEPPRSPLRRENWTQLLRFCVVGASGVLVNLVALVIANRLAPHPDEVLLQLHPTSFNIRWYHLLSTFAFLVANLWNFALNRRWTFGSKREAWWREYGAFLAIGLLAQAVGLVLLTLLMHHGSPIELSPKVFDDSTGFRTRIYWAQLIVIAVTTPLSFVFNKLWTFGGSRD